MRSVTMTRLDRELVRDHSPLDRVIPELTGHALRRQGREWVTPCPWHDDRHPSLRVNLQRQVWFCDVCGHGGDVFTFVMQLRSFAFRDALDWLAQRAGIR